VVDIIMICIRTSLMLKIIDKLFVVIIWSDSWVKYHSSDKLYVPKYVSNM